MGCAVVSSHRGTGRELRLLNALRPQANPSKDWRNPATLSAIADRFGVSATRNDRVQFRGAVSTGSTAAFWHHRQTGMAEVLRTRRPAETTLQTRIPNFQILAFAPLGA